MSSFMLKVTYHHFRRKKRMTADEAEDAIQEMLRAGPEPFKAPPNFMKHRRVDSDLGSVFYLNEDTSADYTIFYIHGGSYIHDFSIFHWRFIRDIIKRTDATVIAPAYKLMPFGSYRDAFNLILPLYRTYLKENPGRKIILMGDSAGGGLAVSLAEEMKMLGIRLPDEMILLSPWVDMTMENPDQQEYQERDPWLYVANLSIYQKHWAEGLDLHDYRVSPTFGDLSGISNTTVFLGTEELLHPDIVRFYEKLDKDGNNELIIGEGMIHVYPLLPIPEARPADEIIYERIMR